MTSPDSPSLSTEIDMDKMLKRLAHLGGPFDRDEDVEIINWLANRELSRRAPALSEGEPTDENLGYIEGSMAPVSPSLSTSSPELTKMLDEFNDATIALLNCEAREIGRRLVVKRDARSAIELSFATLTEQIKRLKTELRINGLTFEQKYTLGRLAHLVVGTEDGLPIEWDKLVPEAQRLLSDNERLRATALTPEEATEIIDWLPVDATYLDSHPIVESARTKIFASARALSGETPK